MDRTLDAASGGWAIYAWQADPIVTLVNGAGLPAVPFRTDTWLGKTEGARPY